MAQVQIKDVVVPAEFTAYQVENSMLSTALFQSGVVLPNGEMSAQLNAGAEQFTVPFWSDIPDVEADISTDNAAVLSTPQKITAAAQVLKKRFPHASWSEMTRHNAFIANIVYPLTVPRSFYFSMSISGYFRRTADTTAACSGFPLDRAKASRAWAASPIG